MVNRFLFLIMAFVIPVLAQSQSTISIPGLGTLPVTKLGEKYAVNLGKMGSFDFTGTLSPLELKVQASIDQLKSFPGYKIYKNMGIQDVILHLSSEGFTFETNLDVHKKMSTLFKFLKIKEPTITVVSKVQKDGFALEGHLNLENSPVKLDVIPQIGTYFKLSKITLAANVGIEIEDKVEFSPGISVKTEMIIKPTKWDSELKSELTYSYNFITQEISGAGAILDTWRNPFGLGNHFNNKDVLVMTNTGIELGWVIGAPSPTKIGFIVENGKLFSLDFGIGMDLSPTDGQLALMANASKLTLKEFMNILNNGFGLKVPDVFPKDIGIEKPVVLFSPNGGNIAGIEIEKGIAISGVVKFLGAFDADLDFRTDLASNFLLDINIDANIKEALMKEIRKIKPIAPIMKQVLSTLEIKKVHLRLAADKSKNLAGKTHCKLKVLHKPIEFDFEGALNIESLVNEIVKKITDVAGKELAELSKKIAGTVTSAGKKSKTIATKAFNEAKHQAGTVSRHLTHTPSHCDKNCVPAHARNLSKPILQGTNDAVRQFYEDVIGDLSLINGENATETRELRSQFVKQEWDNLVADLDKDWNEIRGNRDYVRFYLAPSDAADGGRRFREHVDAEKNKHIEYRNQMWNKLLTDTPSPSATTTPASEKTGLSGRRFHIQSAMNYGKNYGGYWDIPGKPQVINKGSNIQVWNLDDEHDRVFRFHETNEQGFYEIQVGNTSSARVDIDHGKADDGTNVKVWERNGANAQKFRLQHLGNGRYKIYDKNGRVVCLAGRKNENGTNVHIWGDHNGAWMEWYLIDAQTKQVYIP
jgi:hypothetical protein